MDEQYGCLLSYRDEHGEVQRLEAKGTLRELGQKLTETELSVISVDIWHIITTVTR